MFVSTWFSAKNFLRLDCDRSRTSSRELFRSICLGFSGDLDDSLRGLELS